MNQKYNICTINQKKTKVMETKQSSKIETKQVQLIDGEFTPTQAFDILNSLIDQKINYHKIENLQLWEKNHDNDPQPFIDRIQQLEEEKKAIDVYLSKLKKEGKLKLDDETINLIGHNISIIGHTWAFRRWYFAKHFTIEQYIEKQTQFIMGFLPEE